MGLQNIRKQKVPTQTIRIELNPKGEIQTLSNNWETTFHTPSKDILYQSIFKIVHPSCYEAINHFLTFEACEEILISLVLLFKDEEKPIKAHLVKSREIDFDNLAEILQKHTTFSRHFTSEKKSLEIENNSIIQEKLDKFTAFLQQIGSTAKIGGWEVYLEDMRSEWTDETYHIHEVPINTKIKIEEAINFYHPDHREIISEKVENLINTGEEFDVKLKLITAKKNHIWVRALGKRVLKNGQPYKIYGVFQDISHQIRADDILRESEEKFRLISENSKDLICTHEADGTYKYVSPSAKILLGYQPVELVGKNPYDFFHKDDINRINEESHKAVLEGQNPIIQYRFRRVNGDYIWLETISSPIFKHAQVDSIITISRDITERRQKEQALMTEEKRLKMALNATKMGIWEWFVNEEKVTWDENVEKIHGLKKGEFKGTVDDFLKFTYPDDVDFVIKSLDNFLKSGEKDWFIEYRIINKAGETKWIDGIGEMYFDKAGKPVYMIGVTNDITQKVKYEEEIKKLALVTENTDNSVVITDKQGIIEWVNRGFTKMTNYQLEEVIGKKPGDFLQGEKSDKDAIKKMGKAIDLAESVNVELINYDKNKKTYWVALDIQPIFNNDGRQKGFISLQRDITQNKLQEKSLADKNEKLSKANKELDNFVYRVSHDLRAPVSSSLGLLDLAKYELDEQEFTNKNKENLTEYLSMLNRSMTRMDGFICDILDYSRNTRMTVVYKDVELHNLVNDIFQQYRFLNNKTPLTLLNKIEPDKTLLSDSLRLNMILSNLISNSFKFTDSSKDEHFLELTTSWSENYLTLIIKDNGIGIAPEHQSKIFDMFFRASNQEIGSGLGLYIVKESIERINGNIEVASKPGRGTTFTLKLPFPESTSFTEK